MDVFWTADCHFFHRNIIKHNNRPFNSIEEHDEILINNWNSLVPKHNSLVYILGDFAWKDHNKYIARLNGKKCICLGSHDHCSQDVLKNFTEVYFGNRMLNIHNKQFFVSHCCHRVWEKSHYGIPHLFGHSHGRLLTYNMSGDVGVDSDQIDTNKYFPRTHESVLKFIANREQQMEEMGRIKIDPDNGKKLFRQDDVSYFLKKFNDNIKNPTEKYIPKFNNFYPPVILNNPINNDNAIQGIN
jgi:calcineurin-like phosphoesterase family protein